MSTTVTSGPNQNTLHQVSLPPPTNAPRTIFPTYSGSASSSSSSGSVASNATVGFQTVFTKSNIVMLISFVLLYMLLYGMMYLVLGGNIASSVNSWFIDGFAVIIFIFFAMYYYFSSSEADVENFLGNFFVGLRDFLDKPSSFFTILFFIILKYMFLFILRVPMGVNKPYSVILFEGVVWGLLIFDVFGLVFKYFFGFSIVDLLLNPLIDAWNLLPNNANQPVDISGGVIRRKTDASGVDISGGRLVTPKAAVTVIPTLPPKKEVFNVSNNLYTYDEAQAVCQAYGARLANYDDIEHSYNNGGEWCNYGWSEDQMALFPTQKDTWNKLQMTKTHKNDCGRPGINGGYMGNPYIKFGANCFGVKPKPGPNDLSGNRLSLAEEAIRDGKAELAKNAAINAFNYQKWSEY